MQQRHLLLLGLISALAIPGRHSVSFASPEARTEPVVWRIDPVHSGVSFRIRHFVTRVRGKFTDFRGTVTADPGAWQDATVEVAPIPSR